LIVSVIPHRKTESQKKGMGGMQRLKKMQLVAGFAAIFLIIGMAGSTWAYWVQELDTTNEYQLAKYSTEIVEEFIPPKEWAPGADVNKDVSIKNDSTIPVYVKVVINQKWIRTEKVSDLDGNLIKPEKGEAFPLIFDDNGGQEYAAVIHWGKDVVLLSSGRVQPVGLRLDIPTVDTPQEAKGKWLMISEEPDADGNYTLYYMGTLASNTQSSLVVDSVKLNGKIEATTKEIKTVWNEDRQGWVTTTVINNTHSYESARYTMAVTMYTVQATKEAMEEMFRSNSTAEQSVLSYMESFGHVPSDLSKSYDDSVKIHKLYFEEVNGLMKYTPVRGSNENWFMSRLNMVPGGAYEHKLAIENLSPKTFDLYMQVVPLTQSAQLNELLELIRMKVYHGTKLIYDGTAMGKSYSNSINNLHNAMLLGTYRPSTEGEIKVELVLDKGTPLEYAGLLTQIDWKFMVLDGDKNPKTSKRTIPKTGDDMDHTQYVTMMIIAGACLAVCLIILATTSKKRKNEANSNE